MRESTVLFALGLVAFWLVAVAWAWQHPVALHALEPTPLDYHIDVNTADPATLELLPGIGPSIAENLVRHREQGHRFRQRADLEQVHRIGPVTAERIAPWLEFDAPPSHD